MRELYKLSSTAGTGLLLFYYISVYFRDILPESNQ